MSDSRIRLFTGGILVGGVITFALSTLAWFTLRQRSQPQTPSTDTTEVNAATFMERRRQTFPNINLTLISIVQGVALYTLSTETYGYVHASGGVLESWGWQLPLSVTSFILICIATFEYTWFVTVFQWPPMVFDIAIPLGLGFFEILPMYFYSSLVGWGFCSALMCCAGGIAYAYSLIRLPSVKIQRSRESSVRLTIIWYYFLNIGACAVGCTFLLVVSFVGPGDVRSWLHYYPHQMVLLSCAVFFALEVFILIRSALLLSKLGKILEVPGKAP